MSHCSAAQGCPPRGGEGREPDASHGARATTDPRRPFQETIARACCLGVQGESSLRHGLFMEVDVGGEPGETQSTLGGGSYRRRACGPRPGRRAGLGWCLAP